ncbi:hypothetical protein C809_01919 [Lachnospiraceae bacterium MD335]|nr:hypothetical protein C809_01919 [Lachnospiraceae bacterium MD335]
MKHRINIRGVMIPNSYKWYYDFFGEDSTCPKDVQSILDAVRQGDEVEVYINSPGGVIDVGSEIYTLLKAQKDNIKIYITGEACSAASIAAMAGYCEMSPTALMMVHCVSSGVNGNHKAMEHMGEVLRTADKALCTAYMDKAGMSEADALEMMERETWLTAQQAKEKGLIDKIMFDEQEADTVQMVNGLSFRLPTQEQMEKVKNLLNDIPSESSDRKEMLMTQTKFNYLKMRGEQR